MLSFESDYTTGAHPDILKRLVETNMEAVSGYGTDPYTKSAIDKIKKKCELDNAQVYLAASRSLLIFQKCVISIKFLYILKKRGYLFSMSLQQISSLLY